MQTAFQGHPYNFGPLDLHILTPVRSAPSTAKLGYRSSCFKLTLAVQPSPGLMRNSESKRTPGVTNGCRTAPSCIESRRDGIMVGTVLGTEREAEF
jgi:hypothetical protein